MVDEIPAFAVVVAVYIPQVGVGDRVSSSSATCTVVKMNVA